MASEKHCCKCQEKTLVQMRMGGAQVPLCLKCMEAWDRACIRAFETFTGSALPALERAEPERRRVTINCWEGKLL